MKTLSITVLIAFVAVITAKAITSEEVALMADCPFADPVHSLLIQIYCMQ